MRRNWLLIGVVVGLFTLQSVLIGNDMDTFSELNRLDRESGERELVEKGLTREQAVAVTWHMTRAATTTAYHARSVAREVGLTSFLMIVMVVGLGMKEKS